MNDYLVNTQTLLGGKLSAIYHQFGFFNHNGESYPATNNNWPENAFSTIVGKDGEHNSIWYDKGRFLATEDVTFWLSRTPHVAGSSFDEVTGRVVNCVLLHDRLCAYRNGTTDKIRRHCPKNIVFCSARLPAGNTTRQIWSVGVLSEVFSRFQHDFLNGNANEELMMIVWGDFNSAPGSETHNAMLKSGFIDSRQVSQEGKSIEEYTDTTNDWYSSKDSLIDYVWLYLGRPERKIHPSRDVVSVRHIQTPCCDSRLSFDDSLNKTASDHLMVLADLGIIYIQFIFVHSFHKSNAEFGVLVPICYC